MNKKYLLTSGVGYIQFFQPSNFKFLSSYNFYKFFAFPIFHTGDTTGRFFIFAVDNPTPQLEQYSHDVAENQSNSDNPFRNFPQNGVRKNNTVLLKIFRQILPTIKKTFTRLI